MLKFLHISRLPRLIIALSTDRLPGREFAKKKRVPLCFEAVERHCHRLQLILALEWKDASRDYLDVLAATFDHPSYLELENNAQVEQRAAVSVITSAVDACASCSGVTMLCKPINGRDVPRCPVFVETLLFVISWRALAGCAANWFICVYFAGEGVRW